MPTKTLAHCASRAREVRCARRARIAAAVRAFASLALLLLASLIASCIGPGLEPPEGSASIGNGNPAPPTRPAADAGAHPPGQFGGTDGETSLPDPADTPDTAAPAPEDPTGSSEDDSEDAGIEFP
jgi:hypothetical protein